ncbi:MAG TPA: siroheme synthase CysG [Terracidiphilus sp.]|jgi:uroporphyrin-III C-methyltransferase|nr:siroheme synthase CysG [Terracidiphilus sp.]
MNLLPIFLKLQGRHTLVVGAGAVALDKIGSLLKYGACLRVIAPEARAEIHALAADGRLNLIQRPFAPADLDGHEIVIAATDRPEVNSAVYRAAIERGILCNSVDDIPNCDFFFGSIVSRGDLQIAISTAGESPAFAQRVRREIDELLPRDIGEWLSDLGRLRREILASLPPGEERKQLLRRLAQPPSGSVLLQDRAQRNESRQPTASENAVEKKVYLVGAGPGDPDLLTVKALRLIQSADVILHDDLVPQTILDLAPRAEIVNVGKRCGSTRITQDEINSLTIHHARAGCSVVRLKSGDPLIFGRAAEEMDALRAAGVDFEVVPGITSALAAAASIPASLTDRRAASNVLFSTGHHAQSHNNAPLPAIEDATRVVYMPGRDLTLLAAQWRSEGLPPDFPCVLVSRAAQPGQQIRHTTLAALADQAPMEAPSLLLAGWAVGNVSRATSETESEASVPA